MESVIYGVKANEKFYYIGKKQNQDKINNSDICVQYFKEDLRDIFVKNDVLIVKLKEVGEDWYDEKLNEVVKQYKENNPLINPQWMLEGKRGYWQDKTRDANTLKRLSESKHKRIVEYDINGNYIKTWKSIKQVAIEVFDDYHVVNGSAKSALYKIIKTRNIKSRLRNNSYWFREEELLKLFNIIPTKLHIDVIAKKEKERLRKKFTNKKINPNIVKYPVIQYDDNGKKINEFKNVFVAEEALGISYNRIRRICRNEIKKPKYNLKYGKKKKSKNYKQ